MKKTQYNDLLKEYVRRLNDDDLRFLSLRLGQRLGGDVGDAVEFLQRHPDIDRWFDNATTAADFYDMVDLVDNSVQMEARKRQISENYLTVRR